MRVHKITKIEYEERVKELQQQNTDFFGDNKLSTLSNTGDSYSILTFENIEERNSFIESWHETVTVSQRDRGNKQKIEKLRV